MRELPPKAFFVLGASVMLASAFFAPIADATVYGCSNNTTGCGFWWFDAVWNNRYAGNTITFNLAVFNTNNPPQSLTIANVQLTTPWGTFSDNTLPQTVNEGFEYFWSVDIAIPATASPGTYTLSYTFTGTYQSGTPLCYSLVPANICSSSITISVIANPHTLQAQVTSLQQNITALNANINSLNTQIAGLQAQQTTLQAQLSTAKGNITALQALLASTNSQLSTAKASLSTAQGQLSDTQAKLADTQAKLAATQATLSATQSTLSSYSNLYLPIAVAVPSAVAVLLLILYMRKKPGPQTATYTPPPPPG